MTTASTARVESDRLGADAQGLRSISARDIAVRFVFGAAVSAVAGVVGQRVGLRAGGVLLAFPAILPAALTLIERREGLSSAVSDVRGAAAGAGGLIVFAVTALLLSQRVSVLAALAAAAVAWLGTAALLYFGGGALVRLLGDEQYLPPVSVSEAAPLIDALRRRRLTVAVAESSTGGALAAILTAVPRASEVVRGGIVAYTDGMKRDLLGVPQEVLVTDGAVSETAARHMADGVRRRMDADLGIAITGAIGSPAGEVAPGTIFVCAAAGEQALMTRIDAGGSPEACRAEALFVALRLGRRLLDDALR